MRRNRKRKGFTIAELMAVIIIIGLLAAMVVSNFIGQTDKARITTTKVSLKKLHAQVNQFKLDTAQYPSEEEGLNSLIEEPSDVTGYQPGGYLETTEVPNDAWNNEFIYQRYPESGKPFVIISYGADGEPGGEDYEADLYSTDAY